MHSSGKVTRSLPLTLGIDASRNRSGGAKAHLIGILSECDPVKHGIETIHVWAFRSLLDQLPERSWLIKHNPNALQQSLIKQLWWQATELADNVKSAGCDILFTTDASTLCRFNPMVVLSQDMLSYEPGVMRYFGYGMARLRLLAILALQNTAFRRADGVIFLTRYAARIIMQSCGALNNVEYIPHGVGEAFKQINSLCPWPNDGERPIRCLYVSPVWEFKHQWVVVRAIQELRRRGHAITLDLVGDGSESALLRLEKQIKQSDPQGIFARWRGPVSQNELPNYLINSDVFVFASSCENMPVTLLEAMTAGLPIACSDRGPMSEVLHDGGLYFDPENAVSIADTIEKIITDAEVRTCIAQRAKAISNQYSWSRCAKETFDFIAKTANALYAFP